MNIKKDSTSSFLDLLSRIKDEVFQQKDQIIRLTEQLIQSKDTSYIKRAISCLTVGKYNLQFLDPDIRRLLIIFRIIAAEEKLPGSKLLFLDHTKTFEDLMEKYIYITFLLRRVEFPLSEDAKNETLSILASRQVSICALKEITESELFNDPDYVFNQSLQMIGGNQK